jgi:hypothetical protein
MTSSSHISRAFTGRLTTASGTTSHPEASENPATYFGIAIATQNYSTSTIFTSRRPRYPKAIAVPSAVQHASLFTKVCCNTPVRFGASSNDYCCFAERIVSFLATWGAILVLVVVPKRSCIFSTIPPRRRIHTVSFVSYLLVYNTGHHITSLLPAQSQHRLPYGFNNQNYDDKAIMLPNTCSARPTLRSC